MKKIIISLINLIEICCALSLNNKVKILFFEYQIRFEFIILVFIFFFIYYFFIEKNNNISENFKNVLLLINLLQIVIFFILFYEVKTAEKSIIFENTEFQLKVVKEKWSFDELLILSKDYLKRLEMTDLLPDKKLKEIILNSKNPEDLFLKLEKEKDYNYMLIFKKNLFGGNRSFEKTLLILILALYLFDRLIS